LAGASLSLDGALLSLGRVVDPLPVAGVALVVFDGLSSAEGATLHASAGFSLAAESGVVELLDGTGLALDRVAWGDVADAIQLTNGTLIPDAVQPGITVGRPAGLARPAEPLDWVVFAPAEATPGGANGLPAPAVLMPFDGAIFDAIPAAPAALDWYPVPGAETYGLQVRPADSPTAEPLIDVTTDSPGVPDVSSLGPGRYDWSVTAAGADGTRSLPSRPSQFEIVAAPSAIVLAAVAVLPDTPGKQLSVPFLSQHKDTAMLLMERNEETGPHAWDVAHPGLDKQDPADNKNCAIAAATMVNHFFGGDLSQDRIGYELFKDKKPGPEGDLNYGYGILADDLTRALTFALGAAPARNEPGQTPDDVWTSTTASIDAGRPVIAAGNTHAIVLTGYSIANGKRILSYNNPWTGSGKLDIDAKAGALAAELDVWLPAGGSVGRKQEPGVTADTDGDGVVDFDEVERFHTDANRPDSDSDGVGDKQDILSGVFDPLYGYALTGETVGRDFDSDGEVTEHDPDSDEGGCSDGKEDENADGHRNGSETSNFDVSDDKCERRGAYGRVTYTYQSVYDPGGQSEHTTNETLTLDVRLKEEDADGVRTFVDEGSSYMYRRTDTGRIGSDLCDITSQSAYSGGGLIKEAEGVIRGGLTPMTPPDLEFTVHATIPFDNQGTIDYCVFIERESSTDAAQTTTTQDCVAKVADADARPRVYVYSCHETGDGFTLSMTGSITVVP
jgi:hypothetical protein